MALQWLLLFSLAATAAGQHFIATEWRADSGSVRSARYNRNLQNPGSACSPSPCGQNTECMVNNQGNPICSCVSGYIPKQSAIDGCCPVAANPGSRVILHNRLGGAGAPPHLSVGGSPDPCSPSPCGPGTTCSVNRDGNPVCRCVPGYSPNPDTITGCKPECVTDPDCRMGLICRANKCVQKPDPCQPNPCGPGAQCSVNRQGNAICQCEPGLIPNPDTITGCKPECVRDPDCQSGYICQSQRCVVKPDPCDPSPCGPGAVCSVTGSGNAICRCEPGLIPNPDTITGCKPECVRDPDCQSGYICQSQRCVVKPDPCDPSPCGPGAVCTVNFGGNPICRCEPGLVPKPDTITGCGPECVRDPDCQSDYICQSQRCVVKPDPCDPSPCGPNTQCSVTGSGNPICRCLPNFIPKPDTITGCGRECERDPDCGPADVCQNYRCVPRPDPCDPSPCGPNTECNTNRQGNPVCTCLPGHSPAPDTITGCTRIEARTPPPDPCSPSPCGPNTLCEVNRLGNPVCRCQTGYVPAPDTITGCKEKPDPCDPNPCGPGADCFPAGDTASCRCPAGYKGDPFVSCRKGECEFDHECPASLACFSFNCRDPCIGVCGQNTDCTVRQHRPVCSCLDGFFGDPLASCQRKITVGARRARPAPTERSVVVIGQQYNRADPPAVQSRSVVGQRYGAGQAAGAGCGAGCGAAAGRTASRPTFTVVGASKRRRRRQLLRLFNRQ